jgi:RimJ/RimL family protein N-acetyltransferase
MSTQLELHFGHQELARLVQLQRVTNPADLGPVAAHWQDHPLVLYLTPLSWPTRLPGRPRRTTAEIAELWDEYEKAYRARTKFAELFLGPAPFFEIPTSLFEGEQLGCSLPDVGLCQ